MFLHNDRAKLCKNVQKRAHSGHLKFFYHFSDARRSMESKVTRGSGWQHIRTSDDETYVMIFDVYILYEDTRTKNSANTKSSHD